MYFNLNFWGTIFYLILIVFGILISGLSVQLASTLVPPHTAATGVMQYVAESIEASPIQDLYMIKSDNASNVTCPGGFELHPIGIWPGNRLGCYISKNSIGESCIEPDIPSKDARNIFLWGDTAICVKRNIDYKFGTHACGENYRKCSPDLCVSKNEGCPITNISTITTADAALLNSSEKELLEFYNDTVFDIIRDPDSEPLYTLEVSIIGNPCYAKGWVPNRENPYQLLQTQFGCGEYGEDYKVIRLAEMDEIQLYNANEFADILTDLKGYKDRIEGEKVYLVSRQRPQMKSLAVCYESHPEETELGNLNLLESWGEWIFTCVLLELLCVIPLIMFLYRDIQRKGVLKRLGPATKMALYNLIYWAEAVFFLQIYIILKGVRESSNAYVILADRECFIETKLMEAALEFGELAKAVFYPNYTKVSLIVWFGVARIVASILMAYYIEGEKKAGGYNPFDARNKSETEIQWFFEKKDKEDKHYMSI